MKKFSLLFALIVFTNVDVFADIVVLDADTSPQDITPTVIGQTYTVTPVSGAWNDFNGNVSGCNGSGSGCAEGFEFSYSLDPSPFAADGEQALVTDLFSTAAAAFAASQGTTFTALDTNAEFFLPCFGCSGAVGIITLEVLLQQILSTVTAPTVTAPTLTGNDFLALSYDPVGETLQPDSELNFASIEIAETIASIMEDKKTEGLAELLQLEDLHAMNAAAAAESYSALIDIGKGFIEGQAGGKADFLLKAMLGEKTLGDLALEIGKQGVDAVEKGAGMVITLGELGGKITITIYEAVQMSNEAESRNEVWAFQKDRVREAKAEAKDVLRSRDVDSLSSMSPLARVILREMTKDQAVTVLNKIAYTQKSIENSPSERDKAILARDLDRLNEKASFMVNATVGKLIPGEEGWSTSS